MVKVSTSSTYITAIIRHPHILVTVQHGLIAMVATFNNLSRVHDNLITFH